MNEAIATRAELDALRAATMKALALLAHTAAAHADAASFLQSLMTNYRAAMSQPSATDELDGLIVPMLLSVSSVALKQSPDDPIVQQLYRDLRPGKRN